jgi:hypothetical protein
MERSSWTIDEKDRPIHKNLRAATTFGKRGLNPARRCGVKKQRRITRNDLSRHPFSACLPLRSVVKLHLLEVD